MEFSSFIRGILIGFSIAAPVGPIGILCIRRTIANGRISGVVTGLGAATADAFYGSLAAMGLSFLILFLINQQTWLQLVGGAFLCYLGIKTFFEKPARTDLNSSSIITAGNGKKNFIRSRLSDYTSTLFLTLTNPLTILSFTAIFAGIGINQLEASKFQGLMLVAGVFMGSAAWWLLLTTLASAFKERFVSEKSLLWINRISGVIILAFGVIALSVSLVKVVKNSTFQPSSAVLASEAAPIDTRGYARVTGSVPLVFPDDHAAHLDYLTEWWYFTGNLTSAEGRDFGYQLTFFRRSLAPPAQPAARESEWAATQAYMAHFAITDVQGEQHHVFEQLSRGAAGLAGSQLEPFRIWLYGWEVSQSSPTVFRLSAGENGITLNLTLEDLKGPVLHGDQGYSQKSSGPGQASMYYSLTRQESRGTLQIGDQLFEVSGLSWMDHEFSTSALSTEQVGWDWFSFQLTDGSEVMLFQIRQQDGSIDPFSSGTIVYPDGTLEKLSVDDFTVEIQRTWTSPRSSAAYPAGWLIRILPVSLELSIQPCIADQELNLRYVYWEGCVSIAGKKDGINVLGKGYVELTGYAGSMAGEF